MATTVSEQPDKLQMNASLEDLLCSLNSQISRIQSWLKCRHKSSVSLNFILYQSVLVITASYKYKTETTVEDKEQLEQIEKRITSLENEVSTMEKSIEKEEESMVFIERMIECVTLHNKKISNMKQNMPHQLPIISDHYQLPSNALSAIIQYTQERNNNNNKENLSSSFNILPPSQYNNNNNNRRRNVKSKRKATTEIDDNPRANKRRKVNDSHYGNNKNRSGQTPQIEIIGKDEFDSVPKYVKGRLTQSRCNDAINEFNKELTSKYRILQMHPSKMQKYQFDLHERYVREDTKETKNCYWLSHDDFKSSTNFTFDQTGKAIFNVMRHLKRIRMISGKKPKYVVL